LVDQTQPTLAPIKKDISGRFLEMLDTITIEKGFTIKDLCKTIPLSEASISKLRSDRMTSIKADILIQICLKYGWNPVWILTGTGDKRTNKQARSLEEEISHIKELLGDIILPLLNEVLQVKVTKNLKGKDAIQDLINNYKAKSS